MADKQNKSYTKSMLMREIAEKCFLSENPVIKMGVKRAMDTTSAVYNTLESRVQELLLCASPKADINIKLFEGITIKGVYVPEVTKKNNLTGETLTYKPHVSPRAVFTRNFKEKLYFDAK